MSRDQRIILGCLVGLGISLLLVGLVSGTSLRHVIQILPILLAGVLVARLPAWGSYAAMPLFTFWAIVMVLIWLFLLGVSRIANGHYTVIEIFLTVLMAIFSAVGLWTCFRFSTSLGFAARVMTFLLFVAVQLVAMRISFLGPFANR